MIDFSKYCIYCLILPFIIVTINLVTDYREFINMNPYNSMIERLVIDLDKNHLVYNVNMPERKIVKKRIEKSIKGINNIAIGSSNVMLIGKENGFNYLNFGLPGAVIEDIEQINELLNNNKIRIDTLILGIDFFIFNKHHSDKRHYQFSDKFSKHVIKSFFSIRYLYDNLKINKYEIWDGDTTKTVRYKDGSMVWGDEYINRRGGEKKIILDAQIVERFSLYKFNEIDVDYSIRFEKIVNQLTIISNHTILLFHPFHPFIFDELQRKFSTILSVENEINNSFKDNKKITIIGSFNPSLCNLEYSDYYDSIHLNKSGIKKYLINYKSF